MSIFLATVWGTGTNRKLGSILLFAVSSNSVFGSVTILNRKFIHSFVIVFVIVWT